ncbi:hypothetical protein [Acetonema longum]|uniref:Uncharacterized protein n=1 Tax=Acetonema longum DSM 6540 TaxID=1009370 RepID=F7NFU5_9FIRM|nr:hypothetical protein [Acetonema longum]EGO65091.1 hypothetical protein ALO_04643 [Acetonema longum DSM 6540]
MAYDSTKPVNTGYLADAPAELRENFRALKEDAIVNAGTVAGLTPGNQNGNIPVNNGTLNVNLNAERLNGKSAGEFAPAGWVPPVATTSSNGSMSNTDKQKLDGITAGAEPNQNAFSTILVGETTIQADSETDVLEIMAGEGIGIAPDSANDRVTIGIAKSGVTENQIAADAVTDAKIGSRTIADIAAADSEPGTLTAKLSQLGYMIKSITGKSNWYALPTMTLEAASNLFGMSGHAHTGEEGQGPRIDYTNITGTPASLPANGGNADTVDGKHANDFIQFRPDIHGINLEGIGIAAGDQPRIRLTIPSVNGIEMRMNNAGEAVFSQPANPGQLSPIRALSFIGNADTATRLATPRKIAGVDFDGSADIEIPVVAAPIYSQARTLSSLAFTATQNGIVSVEADCNSSRSIICAVNGVQILRIGSRDGTRIWCRQWFLVSAGDIVSCPANSANSWSAMFIPFS